MRRLRVPCAAGGFIAGAPEGVNHDIDGFVAKYSADGRRLWSHQLGTTGRAWITSIAIDHAGNAITVGSTSTAFLRMHDQLSGPGDALVVRYTPNGRRDRAQFVGSASYDSATGTAVDTAGSDYRTGSVGAALPGAPEPFTGLSQPFIVKMP